MGFLLALVIVGPFLAVYITGAIIKSDPMWMRRSGDKIGETRIRIIPPNAEIKYWTASVETYKYANMWNEKKNYYSKRPTWSVVDRFCGDTEQIAMNQAHEYIDGIRQEKARKDSIYSYKVEI